MTAACPTLFPTTVEDPSISYPGVRFELTFDGRRVAGTIHLDQANPMRRTCCKVNYTRPTYWDQDHHLTALRVAAHWLRDIGGIGLLAKRQLCHIVPRLKDGQTEQPMHWAIDAYAQAEWQRTKKAWMPIGKFFQTDAYDVWIERSAHYNKYLDKLRVQREDAERAQRRRDDIMLPGRLSQAALLHHYRLAVQDVERYRLARDKAARIAYDCLTAREQSALRSKCELERSGAWDTDSEGPMIMEHPGFATYVYSRALYERGRRERVREQTLLNFSPRTIYKMNELRDALQLRGLEVPA